MRAGIPSEELTTQNLQEAAAQVLGQTVNAYVALPETQRQVNEIWDRYHAFLILGLSTPQNLDQLTLEEMDQLWDEAKAAERA